MAAVSGFVQNRENRVGANFIGFHADGQRAFMVVTSGILNGTQLRKERERRQFFQKKTGELGARAFSGRVYAQPERPAASSKRIPILDSERFVAPRILMGNRFRFGGWQTRRTESRARPCSFGTIVERKRVEMEKPKLRTYVRIHEPFRALDARLTCTLDFNVHPRFS